MAKNSKLLAALDSYKGRNHQIERQKYLQKQARKRKRSRARLADSEEKENVDEAINGTTDSVSQKRDEHGTAEEPCINTSQPTEDENYSDSNLGGGKAECTDSTVETSEGPSRLEAKDDQDTEDTDSIAFSEIRSLAPSEEADILPHQRLTINNTAALLKAHQSISLPYSSLPFSAHQALTTSTPVSIADANDDLNRELAFYKQCADAVNKGRTLLKREGVPFSRPNDFFAEMVKSEEQMGKIKQKMVDEAANKKAASEARRQRDLKKFGKQVQVAKEQERAKAKRHTLDKINLLKRKRKNADTGATNEEDLFDVALEDAEGSEQRRSATKGIYAKPPSKRQKKDEKFGFGGKKRFSKSGDAFSTGDMSGFSLKKMKARKGNTKRLGKSRRAKVS